MVEIPVKTTDITIRTVRLSKNLLKQMACVSAREAAALGAFNKEDGKCLPETCLGWVHESVLGTKGHAVIIKKSDGNYVVYLAWLNSNALKNIPQLYIV